MQDQQIAGEQKLSPARKHHSWAFFLHASGLFVIFLSNRCCLVERVTERAADEMFVQLLSTSESADCREMAVNTLLRSPLLHFRCAQDFRQPHFSARPKQTSNQKTVKAKYSIKI